MAAKKKSKASAKKQSAKPVAKTAARKAAPKKSAKRAAPKRTAKPAAAKKAIQKKIKAVASSAGVVYADVRRTLSGGLIGRLLGS